MSNPLFPNPTIMPESYPRDDKIKNTPKFNYVMSEFGKNELKSSSGNIVTNPKQAVAIAASESGQSYKQKQSDRKHADRFGLRGRK